MTKDHSHDKKSSQSNPKITRTILNDIRRGGFKRTLRQDFRDIYYFYLDQETRERLSHMGRIKKWIFLVIWILKSLILKLAPTRRILLVVSLILIFISGNYTTSNDVNVSLNIDRLGYLLLLIILMLELKDKWLAQDELAVGRAVQNALLPHQNPILDGWEIWLYTQPANEVGGDLVDYISLNKNKLGLALGDVAGKGLGAALLMAKLQATLRAIVRNFRSLAELGAQLNEIFCRDGIPNRFASMIYIQLESGSGLVRLLNAGHMPPIVMRQQKLEEMAPGAPALGINLEARYVEQSAELKPGDLLLVYSDGLTEARNDRDEFFGEKRLLNLLPRLVDLSPEKMGIRLLNAVENFIGDARRSDDLSLIILKKN